MIKEIQKEISRLEQEKDIKVLFAVESGSRAWGFASIDSDWDVRFVYIHRLDWYLQIYEQKDNIEQILPNDIDLGGWELQKALRLFRKSNPPLLEWLRSPIIYSENYSTAAELRELTSVFFNPKSCLYHYFHMAEGNFRTYLQDDSVRVKKYFYVLRPLLACDWILDKNEMAPMEFDIIVDSQVQDVEVKEAITKLLSRKMSGEELAVEAKNPVLHRFIEQKIVFYKEYLATTSAAVQPSADLLNTLFKRTLNEVWL